MICYGPSHSIIFVEGVVAVDLCPPGMMCKLDCHWLNLYLFVTLGNGLLLAGSSRFLPTSADTVWNRKVTQCGPD